MENIDQNTNTAFVLMSFNNCYKEVYDEVYKKVCKENGFTCWRVDEITTPGSITRDIVDGIIAADVIIADLTSKNANVFYELGVAHTIGKTTIMTSQSESDVPFDVKSYRVIFYEQSITGSKKLFADVDASLKKVKKGKVKSSNPIQAVLSENKPFVTKQDIPLAKKVNISVLPNQIRRLIDDEHIYYINDLKTVNLDKVKGKYRLGSTLMGFLMKIILEYNAYDDYVKIQNYIVHNKVNLDLSRDIFF